MSTDNMKSSKSRKHQTQAPATPDQKDSMPSKVADCDEISAEPTTDPIISRRKTTPQQNQYKPGDLILWNPKENVFSFRSSKLAPKLHGPYTVISQHKNDIECQHPVLHTKHFLHSSRVTPYFGTPDSAKTVALLDHDEFVVEDILQHKGQWNKIKDMTFLVRWSGYDSSHDSWEPWSALRRVGVVHTYPRNHGQASKIPRTLT